MKQFLVQWTKTGYWYCDADSTFTTERKAREAFEVMCEKSPDYDHRLVELRVIVSRKRRKAK